MIIHSFPNWSYLQLKHNASNDENLPTRTYQVNAKSVVKVRIFNSYIRSTDGLLIVNVQKGQVNYYNKKLAKLK